MAAGYEMRVGDAEREAAAAELREHYASGRLTLEELNERVDKAFAATTRGELNALLTDLPSARPGGSSGPGGSFGPGGAGWGQGSGAPASWGGPARTAAAILTTLVVIGALLTVGFLGVFGSGIRPVGIAAIIAAFILLRRLLFGRRRRGCGPWGPPGPWGPRRRRRW